MSKSSPQLVSVHGGHSGQFCNHASNTLEEIIKQYIKQGFSWVGIAEHTPAHSEKFLYPDETSRGLSPELLLTRFAEYIVECRRLQKKYQDRLEIYVAMEIETYEGYEEFVPFLLERFQPDYIVGSVHFVNGVGFDYSNDHYQKAVEKAGSLELLYCDYFDAQFEMIKLLEPSVVGHFDLIRLYDKNYPDTLQHPSIREKMLRNLHLIKSKDLLLDFNMRALLKGAPEPYIARSILEIVRELNIAVAPGDDSHGVSSVGCCMNEGLKILQELQISTDWKKPKILQY